MGRVAGKVALVAGAGGCIGGAGAEALARGGAAVFAVVREFGRLDIVLESAHGTAAKMARAKAILGTANPSRLELHTGVKAAEPTGISPMPAADGAIEMSSKSRNS